MIEALYRSQNQRRISISIIGTVFVLLLFYSCGSISKFDHGKLVSEEENVYQCAFESIDGLIILDAKVNGKEGKFLYDNGFSLCALDQDFAKELNISFPKKSAVHDANNNVIELAETKINSITIGPFELENSYVNNIETSNFLPCDHINGVIGATFIKQLNWKFDFENKICYISKYPFEEKGHKMHINMSSTNISYADIRILGVQTNAMIDFGYQGHIQVSKTDFQNQLEGWDAELRGGIHSLSVSGLGHVDTTLTLQDVPVGHQDHDLLPTSELTVKNHLKRTAIIGINYFENYTLIVNSSNKQYILQPRKDYKPEPKHPFNASLYLIDGEIKVLQMNLLDPVAKQLTLMDRVSRIDEYPADQFTSVCELKDYLRNARATHKVVMIQVEGKKDPISISAEDPIKITILPETHQ